jgi:flagellin-like hook-associated protein FlgL
MRITNTMMNNSTLININRNMRHLDNLIRQIESTKKIQVPSDDPIIASRALKFRASVSEIAQFQRNIQSGMAWMEVSEASLMNINRNLMKQISELMVEGATGTQEYPDKLALIASIRELSAQIGLDMNQTYAGRYVFSGFRTDQPPVLIENNNKTFVITQTFNLNDIEKTIAFHKPNSHTIANEHKVNILKMAYKNMDTPVIPGYQVVRVSLSNPHAYRPPDDLSLIPPADTSVSPPAPYPAPAPFDATLPVIHYIPETGELVMSNAVMEQFKDGTTVTYQKTGFAKGELNPMVYFPARVIADAAADVGGNVYRITQNLPPNVLQGNAPAGTPPQYSIQLTGAGTVLEYQPHPGVINYDGPYWPSIPGVEVFAWDGAGAPPATTDRRVVLNTATGMLIMNDVVASGNLLLTYSATMPAGTTSATAPPSPATNINVQSVQLQEAAPGFRLDNADPNKAYTMDKQEIQYEFATNTYVTINTLSKNVYTDKMYADLLRLIEFAESLDSSLSDPKTLEQFYNSPAGGNLTGDNLKKAVDDHITAEKALLNSMLHDRFNNMLYLVDRHAANTMKEHTQMGSRMFRLELLQIRLEEDEASYTKLMSENEDTDMARAILMKAAAEAAYAAALRASANIVQLSLANFIG